MDVIVTPPVWEARLFVGSFHEGIRLGFTFEKSDFFLPSSLAVRSHLSGVWFTFPRDNLWLEGHPRISHSLLAIPLTLLSAFLLLTKPRKSSPKKPPEHIPTEGV